ncbi:MAG: cupin domain-containing protein [Candidatus Limnocylindrales bacterium]
MEIRRFGIGQRRRDGPTGSHNVQAALIESGPAGLIAELALARHASIEVHTNPNTAWFVVIEGGGFVTVGSERVRVFAGEAVHWPAGIPHGASTELSEMRAIVVEFPAEGSGSPVLEGRVSRVLEAGPAEGRLIDERSALYDPRHGEPR